MSLLLGSRKDINVRTASQVKILVWRSTLKDRRQRCHKHITLLRRNKMVITSLRPPSSLVTLYRSSLPNPPTPTSIQIHLRAALSQLNLILNLLLLIMFRLRQWHRHLLAKGSKLWRLKILDQLRLLRMPCYNKCNRWTLWFRTRTTWPPSRKCWCNNKTRLCLPFSHRIQMTQLHQHHKTKHFEKIVKRFKKFNLIQEASF